LDQPEQKIFDLAFEPLRQYFIQPNS